jgi:hypothetical protein
VRFESVRSQRRFPAFRGQGNWCGAYWSAQIRATGLRQIYLERTVEREREREREREQEQEPRARWCAEVPVPSAAEVVVPVLRTMRA